jgi:hypothetical protein
VYNTTKYRCGLLLAVTLSKWVLIHRLEELTWNAILLR